MDTKVSVGETLGEAFSIYREQAGILIPAAFWIFLAATIVELLAGEAAGLIAVSTAIALALGALFEGIVVSLVRDLRAGRQDPPLRELLRRVLPVLPAMLGALLLAVVGTLFGWLLFFVPGLYLLTIWAVVLQVIVVERRSVFDAFGRSRQLVRGNGWRVLALVALALVIALGATVVLAVLVISAIEGELIRAVLITVVTAVAAPFSGLVTSVLYFRLLEIEEQQPAESSVLE
jgi:hypothetical protein